MMPGDAYPPPEPPALYDFDDCDEMTLAVFATLREMRRRFVARDGGTPTGRANAALIDAYAREIVDEALDDLDG